MPEPSAIVRSAGWLVAVIALGTLAACDGEDKPEPLVTTASAPATPSASASYTAAALNLCTATDLSAVQAIGLSVRGTDPKPPPSAPGAACLFTLQTKDGHGASLRVEASTPETAEQATLLYESTSSVTGMVGEGPLSGLGEQAEAFSAQSTAAGEKTTEYLVHARTGNLVVKTFLTVGGDDYPGKQTLAGPCRDLTTSTTALVTRR